MLYFHSDSYTVRVTMTWACARLLENRFGRDIVYDHRRHHHHNNNINAGARIPKRCVTSYDETSTRNIDRKQEKPRSVWWGILMKPADIWTWKYKTFPALRYKTYGVARNCIFIVLYLLSNDSMCMYIYIYIFTYYILRYYLPPPNVFALSSRRLQIRYL